MIKTHFINLKHEIKYNNKVSRLLSKVTYFMYLRLFDESYLDHIITGTFYRFIPHILTDEYTYYEYKRSIHSCYISFLQYFVIYERTYTSLVKIQNYD